MFELNTLIKLLELVRKIHENRRMTKINISS